jgi:hypothetical protein
VNLEWVLWLQRTEQLIQGVGPILDTIHGAAVGGAELEEAPPTSPENVVQWCTVAWENFQAYIQRLTRDVARHTLAVVCSHYPGIDLTRVRIGYAGVGRLDDIDQHRQAVDGEAAHLADEMNPLLPPAEDADEWKSWVC